MSKSLITLPGRPQCNILYRIGILIQSHIQALMLTPQQQPHCSIDQSFRNRDPATATHFIAWVLPPPIQSLYQGSYIFNYIILIIQLLMSGGSTLSIALKASLAAVAIGLWSAQHPNGLHSPKLTWKPI